MIFLKIHLGLKLMNLSLDFSNKWRPEKEKNKREEEKKPMAGIPQQIYVSGIEIKGTKQSKMDQ